MPPTQLAIATSVVNRLVKEEKSYHEEYKQQEARIAKMEQSNSTEENAEYELKQEVMTSTPIVRSPSKLQRVAQSSRRDQDDVSGNEDENSRRSRQAGATISLPFAQPTDSD